MLLSLMVDIIWVRSTLLQFWMLIWVMWLHLERRKSTDFIVRCLEPFTEIDSSSGWRRVRISIPSSVILLLSVWGGLWGEGEGGRGESGFRRWG